MTKQPHSRIPRLFTRRPLAALLLCLLCMDLAAYRIAETPVVTDTLPDPPLVAVGDDVFVWMYGGKSLVFDPDDEYTEGSCGYGFDWQNCKNGPHDHLHGRVACAIENSFHSMSKLDDGPWVDTGNGGWNFPTALARPAGDTLTALPGHHTASISYYYCTCVHPINNPGPDGCTVVRYSSVGSASFTVVKVASLTSGNVVSTTDTPGDDETVCCGLNDTVTVSAAPYPAGAWPYGAPTWEGDVARTVTADTVEVDTSSYGVKTVTARCGTSSVSIRVVIAKIDAVAVKRSDLPETSFAGTATVAAGGKSSAVHKASVRAYVTPSNYTGKVDLTFTASLSGAAAFTGTSVNGRLDNGEGSVVGDTSSVIHVTHVTDGHFDGILASSNVRRDCTVTIDGRTARVAFEWDCAGSRNFEYEDYFIPEEPEDIFFYPTLQEIAGEDTNNNGISGEGAVNGHSMPFVVGFVKVQFWAYDLELDEFVDFGETTVNVAPGTDPAVVYGLKVSDLIDIDATTEPVSGKYKSVQTVYDDYFFYNNYYSEVQVLEYCFDVYDLDVFAQ
ncbi:MAG: hypothetical protein J6T06_10810 [Victivallales bacterium]|nr:hypothetical protein [Victivallales bacterium]